MTSQSKLIKQGIKYTDKLFDEISQRLKNGVRQSDTLEDFLAKYNEYTDGKGENNPLVLNGYKDKMLKIILAETNNHKFSRPSQKELVRVTIENRVGDLIVDVGEDIQASVRDIVKDGYNNNLSQNEIADQITSKVSTIKTKRARAIARTEIARTATISDYVINKEMGATHFYVECRNTACPICKEAWHKHWSKANDESFTPKDSSAGGKGWIGDRTYSMDDTMMLPPIHPNCYDSETKVFTDNGWKYFKDITETDKILSLNPQTNETEFLEPVKLIQVPNVHGKLYHIHNKWFDVCVTPDHDCFIHQRRDGGNRGKYFEPQFRKPSELSSESRFVRCIDTDRENPNKINVNGLEFTPEDYAFFMAWYISEGSVLHNPETAKSKNYPIKITQEIDANREIIEPVFCNIADYLGIKLYVGKQYFEFHSKALHDYLVQLGKSHEKYIPKEVFTLNKECLNIFLDVYVLGDGHERTESNSLVNNGNERILFTSSKRLRDDLSYLILLCGYYPSIGIHTKAGTVSNHRNGKYVQNHDVYRISINKSKYTTFSSCTVDEIEYSDLVYCVELPKYHTLWVMRNGKTSWNGNCRCVPYFVSEGDGEVNVSKTEPVQTTTTTVTDETQVEPKTTENLPRNIETKMDNFGKRYENSEKEHLQFFTENDSSEISVGEDVTIRQSGKQRQWLDEKRHTGEKIYGTHNHPLSKTTPEGYTLLSDSDVDTFVSMNKSRDYIGLDAEGFAAENKYNRCIVKKLNNFNEVYEKTSGQETSNAIKRAYALQKDFYEIYHPTVTYGRRYLRKKKEELNKQGITGLDLMEKMKSYESKAKQIDQTVYEERNREYFRLVEEMNKDLNPVGLHIEVKIKDKSLLKDLDKSPNLTVDYNKYHVSEDESSKSKSSPKGLSQHEQEQLEFLEDQVEIGESNLKKMSKDNPQYKAIKKMVTNNKKKIKELKSKL